MPERGEYEGAIYCKGCGLALTREVSVQRWDEFTGLAAITMSLIISGVAIFLWAAAGLLT